MASNSLSLRRGLHKRPIVCKKGPPPIPPTPPPVVDCSIIPSTVTITTWELYPNQITASNDSLPDDDSVDVAYSAEDGTFSGPSTILNGETRDSEYQAFGDPGTYTLQATFTFSDETICISFAEYTVEDMM